MIASRAIGGAIVPPIGLGGTAWSFGEFGGERDDLGVATIHAALDAGVRLIDTARVYTLVGHPGHSEQLIARALAGHSAKSGVLVATKGGHHRIGERFPEDFPIDASRGTLRRHLETSLELLGVDRIDLYQLHWPDPNIPMRDAMATFAELRDEGLVRDVGVSNVTIQQLEEARATVPIVSVENHFSTFVQQDRAMLDHCAEQSIAYLAYSPLRVPAGKSYIEAFPRAASVAERLDISIQRLALAWMLHRFPAIIPICGAGRPETIRDSAAALNLALAPDDLAKLDF